MRGIMREYLLRWTLNGMPQAPFLCSEGEGEALLLGHLVASGMVDEAGDIQSIWYDNGLWTVQALLKEGAAIPALMRLDGLKPLESALSLPASEIIACCDAFEDRAKGTAQRLNIPEDRCFWGFDAYRKVLAIA